MLNISWTLPGARVFDVVIRDKSEERVTYNAKVSMTNPYFTPIRVYNVSYTLKTANGNRVIVVGRMKELQVLLPASKNIVVEVPILVPHSQLMADIGGAWNSIYQLDLTVTVDLPLSAGQTIPLAWEALVKLLERVRMVLTVDPHVDGVIDIENNTATFQANVSITNLYTCPVTVKTIYYTLKTVKKDREIVQGPFTENLPRQLQPQMPEMIEVPMPVRYEHLMKLTNDIGVDWDNMYELEIKLTVDLPCARDHPISRTTIAEIQMPL